MGHEPAVFVQAHWIWDVPRRVAPLVLACAASLFLCTALAPGARADDVYASLAMAISSDIRTTEPGVNRDSNTDIVLMHVVEGLMGSREDGSPGLLLAERVDVSPDGRTYRFKLRDGLRFHNGAPVTSADVAWSWRRYLDPKTAWLCLPQFDGTHGARIVSIDTSAPDLAVFQLDRPNPMFLANMATVTCGGSPILHSSSVNADGSWRAPISTGPYRITNRKAGDHIELAAFRDYSSRSEPRDGYTGGKSAWAPTIRFIIIRDAAARIAALMKGQIDVMSELTTPDILRLRKVPSVRIVSAPGGTVSAILIQSRDPLLADLRVRRALELSIDRGSLTLLSTAGTGQPNASMVPASSSYYDDVQRTQTTMNVELARRLLAEAGYKGQPITITTNRHFSDMFDVALLVQAMARKAGVNIQLDVTEWASQVNRYQTGNYQLMSFNYSARPDPYFNYEAMLGDRSRSPRKVWDEPTAIRLLDAVGAEADSAKRQVTFDDLHRNMLSTVPLIVLFNPGDVNGVRDNVVGFEAWSLGRARLWGVQKASLQRSINSTGVREREQHGVNTPLSLRSSSLKNLSR
jgi:peptide/nickel transport system substrate-binding protein